MTSVFNPTARSVPGRPSRRRALLLAAGAACALVPKLAAALIQHRVEAIKTVAPFRAATWQRLLRQGPRPAAYVFTTTFCSTCPDAFDQLHTAAMTSAQPVELAAVVMDAQRACLGACAPLPGRHPHLCV